MIRVPMGTNNVTPHPPPRQTIGASHGTETPLHDFLTLVDLFRNINPNLYIFT